MDGYCTQPPGVEVRRLGPGDEQVLELVAREAADFELEGDGRPEVALAPDEAAAYLADPGVLHWVAEHEGRVLGELLCHLLRMPSGPGPELLLYAIGVRRAQRRRGIGSKLVRTMLEWAATERVSCVWVLADNPDAERFYASCGFRVGGPGEQGVLMLTDLAPATAADGAVPADG
jgi:GNAT superfamily N-acetyltransferase